MLMNSKSYLYLLGGSQAYSDFLEDFISESGGRQARIAILDQSISALNNHKSKIIDPLVDFGVCDFEFIAPDNSGYLNVGKTIDCLKRATGLFIGGGHTPTYHKLYTSEPFKSTIQNHFANGVPVAGLSAGAILCMKECQLTPDETGLKDTMLVTGLSLAKEFVLGVHYSEWDALQEVLEAMTQAQIQTGIGLDEAACIKLENGEIVKIYGQNAFQITLKDFESGEYSQSILKI